MSVSKVCVRIPPEKKEELLALAKSWRSSKVKNPPGWDAKAIHHIAKNHYGGLEEMFKTHDWPERGKNMMPKVQSRICEVYGSVEKFVSKFTSNTKPACAGNSNPKGQLLLYKTEKPSTTHFNQKIWVIECQECDHIYGANGCDFHERKCPKCMNGQVGEPLFPFGVLGPPKHVSDDSDAMVRPTDDGLLDEMGL